MEINNTYADLVVSVSDYIENIISEYRMTTKQEEKRVPKVFKFFTPQRKNGREDADDYPAVIVRFRESDSDLEKDDKIASMRLIVASYNDDQVEGCLESLGLATRIETGLGKDKFIGAFSLEGKIKTNFPEEQAAPFWYTLIDFQMTMPMVQKEINWEA